MQEGFDALEGEGHRRRRLPRSAWLREGSHREGGGGRTKVCGRGRVAGGLAVPGDGARTRVDCWLYEGGCCGRGLVRRWWRRIGVAEQTAEEAGVLFAAGAAAAVAGFALELLTEVGQLLLRLPEGVVLNEDGLAEDVEAVGVCAGGFPG